LENHKTKLFNCCAIIYTLHEFAERVSLRKCRQATDKAKPSKTKATIMSVILKIDPSTNNKKDIIINNHNGITINNNNVAKRKSALPSEPDMCSLGLNYS